MKDTINVIFGFLGAVVAYLFGADTVNIQWLCVLLVFMALDIFLGLITAAKAGTFKRQLLLDGLFRKILMLVVIIVAHMFDGIGILENTANLQKIVTGYLMAYEALSVLNHVKIGGVNIPQVLTDAINNMANKNGGNSGES